MVHIWGIKSSNLHLQDKYVLNYRDFELKTAFIIWSHILNLFFFKNHKINNYNYKNPVKCLQPKKCKTQELIWILQMLQYFWYHFLSVPLCKCSKNVHIKAHMMKTSKNFHNLPNDDASSQRLISNHKELYSQNKTSTSQKKVIFCWECCRLP